MQGQLFRPRDLRELPEGAADRRRRDVAATALSESDQWIALSASQARLPLDTLLSATFVFHFRFHFHFRLPLHFPDFLWIYLYDFQLPLTLCSILILVFVFNFRKDCFDSKWFGSCLKVLLIPEEEISNLQHFLRVVNGSPISFNMAPET